MLKGTSGVKLIKDYHERIKTKKIESSKFFWIIYLEKRSDPKSLIIEL
jgi:hypothetical protein